MFGRSGPGWERLTSESNDAQLRPSLPTHTKAYGVAIAEEIESLGQPAAAQ
jgi:hypothetical protein